MSEWEGEQNNGKQTVLYGSLILTAKDFLSLFSPFFAFCSLCCSPFSIVVEYLDTAVASKSSFFCFVSKLIPLL